MQLPQSLLDALNAQVTRLRFTSAFYRAASAAFDDMNFSGQASYVRGYAKDKAKEAEKLTKYISTRGELPVQADVPAVPALPEDVVQLWQAIAAQEVSVSAAWSALYQTSTDTQDWASHHYFNHRLDDQVDREDQLREIVAKAQLSDGDASALLHFDHRLGSGKLA